MASLYFVLLVCSYVALCHGDYKVKLIQEVFRHGDRAPAFGFPTDTHKDDWPMGIEQLSKIGMQQHYHLGEWIREYHSDFIPRTYDYREINVRSTDVNRTLMSAQSQLAGLYPPTEDEKFLPNLNWRPIPVHTVENLGDYLLNPMSPCKKADKIYAESMQTPEFKKFLSDNEEMHKFINEQAGFPYTDPVSAYFNVALLRDVFECQRSHNLSWPTWLDDAVWECMTETMNLWFKMMFADLGFYRGGPLLKEMRSNMQQKVDGTLFPEERKLFMFSAHDATVAGFLGALHAYNNLLPPYACSVLVELLQDEGTGDYAVQVLYKNETDVPPYPLALEGCDAVCPWDEFERITEDWILEDWNKECKNDEGKRKRKAGGKEKRSIDNVDDVTTGWFDDVTRFL